jgi:hypothetical protein
LWVSAGLSIDDVDDDLADRITLLERAVCLGDRFKIEATGIDSRNEVAGFGEPGACFAATRCAPTATPACSGPTKQT